MSASDQNTTYPAGLTPVSAPDYPAGSRVLTVGTNKRFTTIAAALAATQDGDVVLVDSGTYRNDFGSINASITMIGVGGMVNMVATIPPPNLKGILKVDNNATIVNFSFSGAAIDQENGGNAAGIRYEGGQLKLVNDAFIGNQNGIMGNPEFGDAFINTVTMDHCLFSGNGSGSGNTHNVYIGAVESVVATNSIFESANVGHEFKSRALATTLTNNIFRDGPTATASYDIDVPNGGVVVIQDNVIEKGPAAQNNSMIHYGGESIPYAGSSLLIQGNTFVNDRGGSANAVLNHSPIAATITGNTFNNMAVGQVLSGPGTVSGNTDGTGTALADSTQSGILPGSTYFATDADPHSVTLNATLRAAQGGAGLLTVLAAASYTNVVGGSGGINFSEAPGAWGNQVSTLAGSTNTVHINGQDQISSRGTDRLVGIGGNYTATVEGNAIADDGNGSNQWTVLGTAAITGHDGNPIVSVGAAGNATIGGSLNYLQVLNNGGTFAVDTVVQGAQAQMGVQGGAVNLRVYGGVMTLTTGSGTRNGATVHLGAGDASVFSKGRDVIYAGSGTTQVIMSGAAEVHAGTGGLALYGRGIQGENAKVYGNGGNYWFGGDTGNITYYGGALASAVRAQVSHLTLVGGAGRLTVQGPASGLVITGGSGGLDYDSQGGGGANTVTTAAGTANSIKFYWEGVVDSWGNDVIEGGGGNSFFTLHGDATLNGSSGSSKVTLMGNDTLNGRGQDGVTVTEGANVHVTAGQLVSLHQTAATVAFATNGPTAASAVVRGGASYIYGGTYYCTSIETDLYSTGTDVTLLNGPANVTTNGTATIHAGTGPAGINIKSGNNEIWGAAGDIAVSNNDWALLDPQTIHGGSGKLTYAQGPGALQYIAGTGDASIDGQYGSLDIQAGSGTIAVAGGERGLHFIAGSGTNTIAVKGPSDITLGSGTTTVNMTIWSGPATLRFLAGAGGGTDIIDGFRPGHDHMLLQGVGIQSETMSSGSTNVLLTDGTHIQLAGITSTTSLFG